MQKDDTVGLDAGKAALLPGRIDDRFHPIHHRRIRRTTRHEMYNAAEVYQRARHAPRRRTGDAGQRHGGAGDTRLHVHIDVHGSVAAADLQRQVRLACDAALFREQHSIGAAGIAAELASRHLHASIAALIRLAGKAHLLRGKRLDRHQLRRNEGAVRPVHRIEDK